MPKPKPITQRYQILKEGELGRGDFATVYRAHDTRMGREIALKIIRPDLAGDPAFVERFRQEARTAANLRHPNIVPVYDFGETDDGSLYLAMALIGQGHTLRDALTKRGPLLLENAISILTPLALIAPLHAQTPPLAFGCVAADADSYPRRSLSGRLRPPSPPTEREKHTASAHRDTRSRSGRRSCVAPPLCARSAVGCCLPRPTTKAGSKHRE